MGLLDHSKTIEKLKVLEKETSKVLTYEDVSFYKLQLLELLREAQIDLVQEGSKIYFIVQENSGTDLKKRLEIIERAINVAKKFYLKDPQAYIILASKILEKY
ncbi:MAG TPA: hypothetical protein ENF38_01815 [Candidatus Aenigmarchaeota archaeon]|nr:hypothetical protein [Candidatus Aenigmarchaeota archaeon]